MTAVIYARYSSDNQREESIEGQIRECTAYAEKNGITVIKHYIDRAFSAKTDNRPEFQQMKAEPVPPDAPTIIISAPMSNGARAATKRPCRKNGWKIWSSGKP